MDIIDKYEAIIKIFNMRIIIEGLDIAKSFIVFLKNFEDLWPHKNLQHEDQRREPRYCQELHCPLKKFPGLLGQRLENLNCWIFVDDPPFFLCRRLFWLIGLQSLPELFSRCGSRLVMRKITISPAVSRKTPS